MADILSFLNFLDEIELGCLDLTYRDFYKSITFNDEILKKSINSQYYVRILEILLYDLILFIEQNKRENKNEKLGNALMFKIGQNFEFLPGKFYNDYQNNELYVILKRYLSEIDPQIKFNDSEKVESLIKTNIKDVIDFLDSLSYDYDKVDDYKLYKSFCVEFNKKYKMNVEKDSNFIRKFAILVIFNSMSELYKSMFLYKLINLGNFFNSTMKTEIETEIFLIRVSPGIKLRYSYITFRNENITFDVTEEYKHKIDSLFILIYKTAKLFIKNDEFFNGIKKIPELSQKTYDENSIKLFNIWNINGESKDNQITVLDLFKLLNFFHKNLYNDRKNLSIITKSISDLYGSYINLEFDNSFLRLLEDVEKHNKNGMPKYQILTDDDKTYTINVKGFFD